MSAEIKTIRRTLTLNFTREELLDVLRQTYPTIPEMGLSLSVGGDCCGPNVLELEWEERG